MISKIKYCLNLIWTSLLAYSFPICFELIYLDITGHSKGYGYDLGSEKDISIMSGCVELLIWLILAVPSTLIAFGEMGTSRSLEPLPNTRMYCSSR